MGRLYRLSEKDNVAVAAYEMTRGDVEKDDNGVITILSEVPKGFKVATKDIDEGEDIIKYGFPIGRATRHIEKGEVVHTFNMTTNLGSRKDDFSFTPDEEKKVDEKSVPRIMAYKREDGRIGCRNGIWVIPLSLNLNILSAELRDWGNMELNVPDGIHSFPHAHSQSQFGEDKDFILLLFRLITHPDNGGVLLLALDSDKEAIESLLGNFPLEEERLKILFADQVKDEKEEGKKLLAKLAEKVKEDKRSSESLSKLVIGLKCGQSDALSAITSNRLIGNLADYFSSIGASVILTEVPEMLGSARNLLERGKDEKTKDKIHNLIERYRKFLESEGKKLGEASPLLRLEGISTEEEESMGAVQKAGRSKINDVIEYGELVREKGVTLLSASGSDAETSTALTLSGANVILFSTGVGTPYGAPVPTIKFASSRELCERKPNWIDFDASRIMKEDKDAVALSALSLIIAIASGDIRAKNEINGNMEIAYNCNDIK